ncbi:c-type cytochrome [bacterium]|nr:c-type cytochrome [bacterium]
MRRFTVSGFFILMMMPGVLADDFPLIFNTEPNDEQDLISAEEAAAKIEMPEGFHVSVFASEPEVQNPIAMTWDSSGRLWIAENYTYAERQQRFQLDLRDRVVILDGTDEGRHMKRTVFTDQVQMLTGIEVGLDGVWLMCPPRLLFIPDRNHDDIPDSAGEVVLDGFTVAEQNYHNFANGIRFGPDGWLYGRCGGSCPGRIGLAGAPDHERLALEGGIWRYHPIKKSLEVLTTGTTNPWGHDWNSVGEGFFVNTVNGHLWHLIPGAHFTRPSKLDPNRKIYEMIDFHADHWHFDTGKNWTDSRDGAANQYGGGHAHIGTMIYQGDNWPENYRNKLFTLNMHGRRANQERLERQGSGYVAKHESDLFLSQDSWFRGMELSAGPDGSVFVIDWSDAGECHEHTGVHRTSGRVFKVRYGAESQSIFDNRDIRAWSQEELSEAHRHRNLWFTQQARLELLRRRSLGEDLSLAIEKLQEIHLNTQEDQQGLLVQSFLSLHVCGAFDLEQLHSYLTHPDEHVRVSAIRCLTENWTIDDAFGPTFLAAQRMAQIDPKRDETIGQLISLASNEQSALVRLALASSLQRLPMPKRAILAEQLVKYSEDADDHNLPLMIWYGLVAVSDERPGDLIAVAEACEIPTTLRLIARSLSERVDSDPNLVDRLLQVVLSQRSKQLPILEGLRLGLRGSQRATMPSIWAEVSCLKTDQLKPILSELSVVFGDGRAIEKLKQLALDRDDPNVALRIQSLKTLIQSRPGDLQEICEDLLTDNRVNFIAAQGLASFDQPEVGESLVQNYKRFRGAYRPQVISTLVSRASFASMLVSAIEDGDIPRSDLSAYQVRQIRGFGDSGLSQRLTKAWGEIRETPEAKTAQIQQLKERLGVAGQSDLHEGRKLFQQLCRNCHRLYGDGEPIGPDLTGGNRSNLDYLLHNIIDPSSVVDKDFRMQVLLLDDGRTLNGLVIEESNRTLTLQTATERLTLDRNRVESIRKTTLSPMPDGLLDSLKFHQIKDLLAYLQHPTQVSLPSEQTSK